VTWVRKFEAVVPGSCRCSNSPWMGGKGCEMARTWLGEVSHLPWGESGLVKLAPWHFLAYQWVLTLTGLGRPWPSRRKGAVHPPNGVRDTVIQTSVVAFRRGA